LGVVGGSGLKVECHLFIGELMGINVAIAGTGLGDLACTIEYVLKGNHVTIFEHVPEIIRKGEHSPDVQLGSPITKFFETEKIPEWK
jgi:hypothetical protein